jgi:hypothetical protein
VELKAGLGILGFEVKPAIAETGSPRAKAESFPRRLEIQVTF